MLLILELNYPNVRSSGLNIKNKPVCIVANTIKGKGVSFMEGECGWHGKAPSEEEKEKAIRDCMCKA